MRRRAIIATLGTCLVLGLVACPAPAAVKLPAVFSDNMILQRDRPVPVWGWAAPEEEVTVTIARQTVTSKAGKDGRWQTTLAALETGGPYELMVASTAGKKTFKNVLIGEVWLCSGQSNMEWPVAWSLDSQKEIAAATYPKVRLFTVPRKASRTPLDDCAGRWVECSPQAVSGFSAAGYFFIRMLHKELGVPVGVINASWGGTPAAAWTGRKALESEPSLKPLLDNWDRTPNDRRKDRNRPASLYNGMIAPVVPFAIRGVIWYQGEADIGRAYQYRTLFPLMIRDWRAAWGEGDFPFGFVQLAPFRYPGIDEAACAELREAQTMALASVANTGMAVTMDIGNIKDTHPKDKQAEERPFVLKALSMVYGSIIEDIHPKNKQDVGRRLALWALARVYGKDLVYSGPIYKSMSVQGDKVRIRFDHIGGGLKTRDGKKPSDFAVAGADQRFHPAEATIDNDSVVVHSDAVREPVAVRYAWRDAAEPNLANQEGLPASPFRTDPWRGVTEDGAK